MSLQYSGSCESGACNAAFGAGSSLSQGETFAKMTAAFHGGRRSRKASHKGSRKAHRKGSRKSHRKSGRKARRMHGGSAAFPAAFSDILPSDMHAAADISSIDKAYAQLPEFAGKYGMSGGALGSSPIDAPSMLITPGEERAAFLNPQWYTENEVVPSFKGPQSAGSRKRKASKKSSRKARKASKKSRRASKKSRKASRKSRRSSRK